MYEHVPNTCSFQQMGTQILKIHRNVITYNSDICSRLADIVHCIGCFTGLCPLSCKKVHKIYSIVCKYTF